MPKVFFADKSIRGLDIKDDTHFNKLISQGLIIPINNINSSEDVFHLTITPDTL
jgi:hypothetical protein